MLERRNFMTAIPVASLAAVGIASSATAAGGSPIALHQVFFWLKRPGSQEDKAALIEGLNSLRAISQARQLYVGVHHDGIKKRSTAEVTFDVSIAVFFDSVADHDAYLDHPLHDAFIARCAGLWERVIHYDSLAQ
jgi:hypothetical protein